MKSCAFSLLIVDDRLDRLLSGPEEPLATAYNPMSGPSNP